MRVTSGTLIGAIPLLTLVWFGPNAWNALVSARQVPDQLAAVATTVPAEADPAAAASQWQETAKVNLVAEARKESAALNNMVRSLRAQLLALTPGSFQYQLVLQSLTLAARQRDAWDSNWRRFGVAHANQAALQRNLAHLLGEITASSTALQVHQATEVTNKTISAFAFPSF
jgi:hypothetical protein